MPQGWHATLLEHPLAPAQNHLLGLLPAADLQCILERSDAVQLRLGEVLCEAGAPLEHAYFPVDGFISLLARISDHPSLEVGMVGREGLFGAELALGVTVSPLQALVQGSGQAWRIPTAMLRRELARSAALRQTLQRYLYVVLAQMSSSAACLHFHLIGPRLARWLLMSADRAHANHFHATHEILACMLGVRRVGVTVAAGALQRQGLIAYHRGQVTLLDRTGLEAAACPCYARQYLAYQALMG